MLRTMSLLFGLAFVAIGIAGYMPAFTSNGLLFGIYEVDSMHNIVHIVSGIIALLAAAKASYAKLYFQVFGLLYGATAVIGFWHAGDIFGMIHVNTADNILHTVIAVIALYFGFLFKQKA